MKSTPLRNDKRSGELVEERLLLRVHHTVDFLLQSGAYLFKTTEYFDNVDLI